MNNQATPQQERVLETVRALHKTRAAGTGSTGHSNPRYATGGNATAHRTPNRRRCACGERVR